MDKNYNYKTRITLLIYIIHFYRRERLDYLTYVMGNVWDFLHNVRSFRYLLLLIVFLKIFHYY